MVILDQSKPILLIFKIKKFKNSKIQNLYIAGLLFIKTDIRQLYNPSWNRIIHLLCSIISFARWRVKKLSSGGSWGNGENHPNCFLEVLFRYLLRYTSILLGYPSNNRTFMTSIGSWYVIIHLSIIHVIYNALLKSDVSGLSKAYSLHTFQSTGIRLGSLWRGNRCVLPIIWVYL